MKSIELSSLRSVVCKNILTSSFNELNVVSRHTGQSFFLEWASVSTSKIVISDLYYCISSEQWTLYLGRLDFLSELWFGSSLSNADISTESWILDLAGLQLRKDFSFHSPISISRLNSFTQEDFNYLIQEDKSALLAGYLYVSCSESELNKSLADHEEVDVLQTLIHFHGHFALDELTALFAGIAVPKKNNKKAFPSFGGLDVRVPLHIGFVPALPFDRGDILLISHSKITNAGILHLQMQSAKLLVCFNAQHPSNGEIILEQGSNELLSEQSQWWDVPQQLTVRAGCLSLTVQQILSLQTGEVLQIPQTKFPKVSIFNGDKEIATGELVDCDGQLAVQILGVTHRF